MASDELQALMEHVWHFLLNMLVPSVARLTALAAPLQRHVAALPWRDCSVVHSL